LKEGYHPVFPLHKTTGRYTPGCAKAFVYRSAIRKFRQESISSY
jgi:hypothetical protein